MVDVLLCGEPHPEHPEVFCDKPDPCTGYHANAPRNLTWGYRPLPTKKTRRDDMRRIVENAEPSNKTGPPLATRAHARRTDPETSHQAADSLLNLRPAQQEVLLLFGSHGPMTDERLLEVAETVRSRQTPSGLRTRRSELVEAGYIEDSGERRQTSTGHNAIVWQAVWR